MAVTIHEERPDTPAAMQLIDELEANLAPHYPTESRHGYTVEKLLRESVTFFVVRSDGAPAGCGGVQLFDTDYAELKRMYVRPDFRGLGLGKLLVNHLAAHSLQHGVKVLRLETGVFQEAAIGLYERMGFERIAPFGDYREDPLSVFFEKRLM
jgi:ribosomal protein S18 acetylase RimI-like enzyme